MRDAVDYLYALSDDELVCYWALFHDYPTHDRHQRARLDRAVMRHERERIKARPARRPERKSA